MKPTHPKARRFLDSHLFDGLADFSELERRISALGTTEEKGDAFEVFVEAHLATQSISQAKRIWAGKIPPDVRHKLNLPPNDEGIDGVYENTLGELIAYQAKFRSDRAGLTWRDLSTFIGLSESADQRVLLTNTDHVAATAKARSKFSAYRGHHFDDLGKEDFEAVRLWLETGRAEQKALEPYPHNRTALEAIGEHLPHHARGRVIMACGTGKTLVAMWAAKEAGARNIVVLVPSLSLLQQTLEVWTKNQTWGKKFRYLAVCSDPTVTREVDSITLEASDLSFRVDTEPAEIARFLSSPGRSVKVIFSTYQSSTVVAEGSKDFPPFDLGIFDEAHKTAGREGTKFSFALRDENIPMKKRLFFTATPRHYNISKKNKEGEAKLVFSMDDEQTYGPLFHRLSFAQAAADDVICGYKVLISVIDSETVNNHLLDHGEVLVEDDLVRARQVAAQIALKAAVKKSDARRIITFHSRVAAAKSFSADGPEGIGVHLPEFSAFHVNGKQSSGDRDDLLKEFRTSKKSLVTNARCLTEGIDVPAVDMVAFIAPKKSRIDIAQAAGRAMRKDNQRREKETGFILVPIFLEKHDDETIEEALARSDFSEVADVLNAMQEQDDELVDIITEMNVARRLGRGVDESKFREKVEFLGPEILLSTLRETIAAELVERLGNWWEKGLAVLKEFVTREGHARVPLRHTEGDFQLGTWVNSRRQDFRKNQLSDDRRSELASLNGWIWDPLEADFLRGMDLLENFVRREGHAAVPARHEESEFRLGPWCAKKRLEFKAKRLSAERVIAFEAIAGWRWEPLEARFSDGLAALKQFVEREGHARVPSVYEQAQFSLGQWVSKRREDFKVGRLSSERITELESIDGWLWDLHEAHFVSGLAALNDFIQREGHARVPAKHKESEFPLGSWVSNRRKEFKKGRLSSDRITELESSDGWIWDQLDADFVIGLAALNDFIQREGHARVPTKHQESEFPLGNWVSNRRGDFKVGRLSSDRIKKLESIGGWAWDGISEKYMVGLAALRAFAQREGHARVPGRHYEEEFMLGKWVTRQRSNFRKRQLSAEQIAELESIDGWIWDSREENFANGLTALKKFLEREGPGQPLGRNLQEDGVHLGRWVESRRREFRKKTLPADRIAELEALEGWTWEASRRGKSENDS